MKKQRPQLSILLGSLVALLGCGEASVVVSSKNFTESYVLGELVSQRMEAYGHNVDRRFGLGDTALAFSAVESGEVDFYVEYTGTISNALLRRPNLTSTDEIRRVLETRGLTISDSLGFENTYAIVVRRQLSEEHNLQTISDLNRVPGLRVSFTHTFLERPDSYPRLKEVYGLSLTNVSGIAHGLKAEALASGSIDVTDLYTTDAKLSDLDVVVLKDDRQAFPKYEAVLLTRLEIVDRLPNAWRTLQSELVGRINETQMIAMNAAIEIDKVSFAEAAAKAPLAPGSSLRITGGSKSGRWSQLVGWLLEHLILVFVPVLLAAAVGIPLGILANNRPRLGQFVLASSGLVQTIPSLALLCFLLPWFGVGKAPALIALTLYALLPIVRGTFTGLSSIDKEDLEVAQALGLSKSESLRHVELPLASRSISSGLKTSSTITVGTATIAAFIGAGGLGQPIVTGLGANQMDLILWGAIPAAVLALALYGLFELLDVLWIPKGLRTTKDR